MLKNIERLLEARLNKHQTHMEDVIVFGKEGFSELIEKSKSIASILEGSTPEKNMTITTKIDGSPALVVWTKFNDRYLNKPGVSLKGFMSARIPEQAEAAAFYSPEEVIAKYGDRPDMCTKINGILEALIDGSLKIPEGEAWQGDLLFDENTLGEYKNDDGDNFITFQPNTILYAVPANSETANKIKQSKVGIAFHTRYTGEIGNLRQTFNLDTNRDLESCPEDLYIIDAQIPNLSGQVSFNEQESEIVKEMISELETYYNELTTEYDEEYETLCSNEDFIKMYFQTYQNKVIADEQQSFLDEDNFIRNLEDYCFDKIESERNKKVPALKTEKGRVNANARYDSLAQEIKYMIENNIEVIQLIVKSINVAVEIKQAFMEKIAQASAAFDTYYSTSEGVVPGTQEGIAVSDDEGNIVKLVDRTCFSFHNRSADTIKGWQHPEEKIKESLLSKIMEARVTQLTKTVFESHPEYKTFIEDKLGGKFLDEAEVADNLDEFTGLFIKADGEPNINNNTEAYNKAVEIFGLSDDKLIIEFEDGKSYSLRRSNKFSKDSKKIKTSYYVKTDGQQGTSLQEAIFATLLEMKAHGVQLPKSDDKKVSDLKKWFLESDPIEGTNICEYIDFDVPVDGVAIFREELASYLDSGSPKWIKSFETLWVSDVLDKISGIFKEPILDWKNAKFYHHHKIGCPEELIKYFIGKRCGKAKDLVDKSDIVLAFSNEVANDAKRLTSYSLTEEDSHNSDMNTLLGEKNLIGISLKKIKGTVSIVSINFNADTTGIGPLIKDESKVMISYYGPENDKNTLGDVSIIGSSTDSGTRIRVDINNSKDIHVKESDYLILNYRHGSGNDKTTRVVELGMANAAAQMGKCGEYMKSIGFNPSEEFRYFYKEFGDAQKAQDAAANKLLNILKDPKVLAEVISAASGYPLYYGSEDTYKMSGAPYIKLY